MENEKEKEKESSNGLVQVEMIVYTELIIYDTCSYATSFSLFSDFLTVHPRVPCR